MEQNYSIKEKRAIVKVLNDIMCADGDADKSEVNFLAKVIQALQMSRNDLNEALALDVDSSAIILKNMNRVKKKQLSELMEIIATIDGRIAPEELSICTAINIAVDIPA
ncbi:MAG: TerB family tellurite resistance protein [Bacteroidota bacterium]